MPKAALHEHLKTSSKLTNNSFNYAIDLASKRLGNNGIFSVVDFDDKRYSYFIGLPGFEREYIGEDKRAVRVKNSRDNCEGVVIHGEEVPTKQGHILVLGLGAETHLKHKRTIEDTIKEARDYNPNTTIIADHPFYISGLGDYLRENKNLLEKFDALEINGEACFGIPFLPFPYRSNKKVLNFYKEVKKDFLNLGLIYSQDGHSFYEFCSGWCELQNPDLSSGEKFSETFRKSVQNTNENTLSHLNSLIGTIGAIDHILKLIWILKIAPKIGLGKLYEVERPNNK